MTKFLAIIFVAILARVGSIQIVFDNVADISKVADMSCAYNDDYQDFWAYGCERSPSEDVFPEKTGFWTGCNANCELIYHGGLLPKPAKLRVETYIQGINDIAISGKNTPTDTEEHDFGYIDSQDETWCYREIDLADFPEADASVINFKISSESMGFVLIDKIIVDLGDQPIQPITLDSKSDELPVHWSYDDCHHLEDYADFWTFGCPVEPEDGNPQPGATGYWSPCKDASCKIEFATSPSIIPSSVKIRGYVEGDGQIKVALPEGKNNGSMVIETITSTAAGGWVDFDVDLSSYKSYKVDIVLESNGGVAVLDSLSYSFDGSEKQSDHKQSEMPMCIQKQATTPTTTVTTTSTTTTPTTTRPTTTGPTTVPTGPTTTGPTTTTRPTTTGSTTTESTITTPTTTTVRTTTTAGSSVPLASLFTLLACIIATLR